MMGCKIEAVLLLLFLEFVKQKCAQPTAVITPSQGYNASLDPDASFTFQCDVTGANGIQWLVDGSLVSRQDIRGRGISEGGFITIDEASGRLRSTLTIVRNTNNNNTTIICTATSISQTGGISSVPSEPVLFKIQGLLDAPSNLILSEDDNQHGIMRRLSWVEPFSLDITDVNPDIKCYNVCYRLVSVPVEADSKSQCTCVNQTEYTFLNISVPLLFTVSAINIVGEGDSSQPILHDINGCNNTVPVSPTSEVQVSYLPLNNIQAVRLLFQQQLKGDGLTCFQVYKIETFSLSLSNTMVDHGIQIPGVVQYSQSSVQLSLTVDSDLVANEKYSATITSINAEGEKDYNVTVEFDTYDVKLVSGRAIAGGLELSCTFAERSQAQSCILTVYRVFENGMELFVANISISRVNPQTSGRVLNLEVGEYVVREVAEVESDGQVTIHRRRDVLELSITEPSSTKTTDSTMLTPAAETPSNGDVSLSRDLTGAIIGAVLVVLLFAGITVTILVLVITYHRHKVHKRNQKTTQPQAAIYEEPYDWAVSRLPQTEPEMEQCPAYGVLTK